MDKFKIGVYKYNPMVYNNKWQEGSETMSKFYSVKQGDKLRFIGCSCGYGLYLNDVVECIEIRMDKFFWINPHTGERRMTVMGSPCFELVKEEVVEEQTVKTTSRKKKSK